MDEKTKRVVWHPSSVTVDDRRVLLNQKSCVVWLTGLPSSGKSTIANALCRNLHSEHALSYVLDGDNIRHGLNVDLGFGPEDRKENIRRIGEAAKLFVDAGLIVITAFISPFREDRLGARHLLREGEFIEVFVRCSLKECQRRDPKGMYKQAQAGMILEFTGVSSPYEEPENPEIILDTDSMPVEDCVQRLFDYLVQNQHIQKKLQ